MKYHSKHSVRDTQLPRVRDEMLAIILSNLESKEDILGIFLGGSLAKNNFDLFSDIDLRIIVPEDKFDNYVKQKQEIIGEFGEVLFYEDMYPQAPFTIAHYDNFLKVDLFIYTYSRIHPSIWLQGIKICKDSTGDLRNILEESEKIVYTVTREEVEKWRGKIFSYIHEVYRRVFREEFYYALGQMNNLRSYIVSGWNMEVDRHSNEAWDWSKIEGERSQLEPWQLASLKSWNCDRDQQDIMKTLYSMVPEIKRLHAVLCQKTGLDERKGQFEKILSQVL
jgi:predicted nucleotidyltransferase